MLYRCRESEPNQDTVFSGRKTVDIRSLPVIQEFLDRFSSEFCEHNIVNLISWAHIYGYEWFCYRGRLMNYDSRSNVLMMPPGPHLKPEDLYALAHEMMCDGMCSSIGLVTASYLRDNPRIQNYFHVEEDRDSAEYIYKTENLIRLNSKKLHKKKNLVSQFHRTYPDFRVRPVTRKMLPELEAFSMDLLHARNPVPDSLKEEFSAMRKAFALWEILGLEGLAVYVKDKIAAFAVFSALTENTANIHFEKPDMRYKGVGQVINQETAKYLDGRFAFINREQDLGIPGLRQAKLSYEPYRLIVPHVLRLKANA